MKIGILTYHRSINYGALMQCYALTSALKKKFPNDTIEVIDYVPQHRIDDYSPTFVNFVFGESSKLKGIKLKVGHTVKQFFKLIKIPTYIKMLKVRYESFQNSLSFIPLFQEKYRQEDAEEFRNQVCGKYDVIVVGSDCVWNWSTVMIPNAYFLSGDYKAVKISFAASVGVDDYKKLPTDLQKIFRKIFG